MLANITISRLHRGELRVSEHVREKRQKRFLFMLLFVFALV